MSFKIDCPHCKRTLNVTEKAFGKTVPCPFCSQPLAVPQAPRPQRAVPPVGRMAHPLPNAQASVAAPPPPAQLRCRRWCQTRRRCVLRCRRCPPRRRRGVLRCRRCPPYRHRFRRLTPDSVSVTTCTERHGKACKEVVWKQEKDFDCFRNCRRDCDCGSPLALCWDCGACHKSQQNGGQVQARVGVRHGRWSRAFRSLRGGYQQRGSRLLRWEEGLPLATRQAPKRDCVLQ